VRPDHGGRLELKLLAAAGNRARYAVTVFTPEAEVSCSVAVDEPSLALEFGEWQGGAPPPWLEALARTLLRTVVRTKLSEGEWPRRVTRWRPAPAS
jgi:hypothetical protein